MLFLMVLWLVLVCLEVFWLVRTWRSIRMRPSPEDVKLTTYQAAYLLGGRGRVVETAIAKLLDDGRLRAARGYGLVRVEGTMAEDPVDVAVLSAAWTPAPFRAVVRSCLDSAGVLAVAREMSELGLIITHQDRKRLKLFQVCNWVLFALGLAIGMSSDFVPFAIPFFVLVLIVCTVQSISIEIGLKRATSAGDRMAWRVRSGTARTGDLRNPMVAPVVLQGFQAYPDAEVRNAAYGGQPARYGSSCSSSCGGGGGCSSSSCSSSSDSGSSSCGGGSSCSSSN